LNIPYHFPDKLDETFHEEELKETKIPDWLNNKVIKQRIKINHCPDWGDLTKLFGVLPLEKNPGTFLILFSHYQYSNFLSSKTLEFLVKSLINSEKDKENFVVFSNLGFCLNKNVGPNTVEWYIGSNNPRKPLVALSSLGGLICYRGLFENDINNLQKESKDLFKYGDLVISDYLLKKGVKLDLVPFKQFDLSLLKGNTNLSQILDQTQEGFLKNV